MEPSIAEETDPPQEKRDVSEPDEEKESVSVPEKEEEVCVKEEEECRATEEAPVKEKPPPKKRGPPKQPKVQCTICLRYYSMKRVVPGGHANCVPPVKKDTALPPVAEEPPPPAPPPPPAREDTPAPAIATASTSVSRQDVVRFLASERMNRHARRAERWHQQMFG